MTSILLIFKVFEGGGITLVQPVTELLVIGKIRYRGMEFGGGDVW